MRTIQEQWESYKTEVLPADAGAIQIQECRRAFYGGAMVMFGALTSMSADDDVSDDAFTVIFEGVQQELDDFFSRVGVDM